MLLSDARGKELGRLKPVPNMLVQFDGELMHRVTPFECSSEELEEGARGRHSPTLNLYLERSRISLVCEHYRLEPALLIRVPEFHLETSRGFGEFFDKALETQGIGNEA